MPAFRRYVAQKQKGAGARGPTDDFVPPAPDNNMEDDDDNERGAALEVVEGGGGAPSVETAVEEEEGRGGGAYITSQRAAVVAAAPASETKPTRCHNRRACCVVSSSALSLAAFAYAAVVQYNDPDGAIWGTYYALLAGLSAAFLILHFRPPPPTYAGCGGRCVLGLIVACFVMVAWSIALIVKSIANLAAFVPGYDGDEEEREEYIFEIAGASLGLLSAAYHCDAAARVGRRMRESRTNE